LKSLFIAILFLPVILFAQSPKPDWSPYQFLIGDWIGEGGGAPGQGTGGFTFSLDLQNQILVRKNYADYPATPDKPAYRHDDLLIVYQIPGQPSRADYWDNEGHVIHYTIEIPRDSVVAFIGDIVTDQPRYRLVCELRPDHRMRITFDIAPANKPQEFQEYIEAFAHRK
jgi:hypothetical protein